MDTKVHPALMYKDEPSIHITNLGQGNLKDVLLNAETYFQSQKEILCLMLSSEFMHDLGTTASGLWREKIIRDFPESAGNFKGVPAYYVYHFLSCFSELAGMYIINNASVNEREKSSHFDSKFEFLEVKIANATTLALYVWRTDDMGNLSRGLPVLEEGLAADDDGTGKINILPFHKDKRHRNLKEKEKRRMLSKWLKKKISLAKYLSCASSLHENLIDMIAGKYLMPLQIDATKGLDCQYLNANMSWPRSLPKPGFYSSRTNRVYITVKYSDGHFLKVEMAKLNCAAYFDTDIAVDVRSAMTMTAEEQHQRDDLLDYLNYDKGLTGNPNQCTHPVRLHMPSYFTCEEEIFCRAWYSPVPASSAKNKFKLIVVDADLFIIIRGASARMFKHKFHFEDEYAINLLQL